MESYMDWVNNHFTEVNNGGYLEMYKLADSSIKRFLDEFGIMMRERISRCV